MKKMMIRAIALAVTLVLALGCASCALSQNYEYINDAIRKTAVLDSAEAEITTTVQIDEAGDTLSSSYRVKMNGLQTKSPAFSTAQNVTLYGETVPASVYGEDTYYYVVTQTDAVKLASGELLEKTDFVSDWRALCAEIPEEILKGDASVVDRGDGTKVAIFSVHDANAFAQIYGGFIAKWHEKLVAEYVGAYSESSLTLSDMQISLTVDTESGYLVNYGISCRMAIDSKTTAGEDRPLTAKISQEITYHNAGADITLDKPEGYEAFPLTDGLTLDPYQLMTDAVEKAKLLNDFKANVDIGVSFKMMGMEMDMPTSIALCVKGAKTEAREFSYAMTMSAMGMEITQNVYFKDGFYYMDDGVNRVKYPYSLENEKSYGYEADIDMLLKTLPEKFFEGVEVERNADGTKTIRLVGVETIFRYYTELTESLKESLGYNLLWAGGDVTVVIASDGSLQSYMVELRPDAFIEGIQTSFDITYGITYENDGAPIVPTVPERMEEYQSMADLNREVFEIVNKAVENARLADEMSVVCTLLNETTAAKEKASFSQTYTLAGKQLRTNPVYRYLVTTQMSGYTFSEDVYYEDGYYVIASDLLEAPVRVAASEAGDYDVLPSISETLKSVPAAALEDAVTQGSKNAVCTLYLELDDQRFGAMFPDFWSISVENYRISNKTLKNAVLEIKTSADGKLLSYTIVYELRATLTPTYGLYLKDEALTVSQAISYLFDTSGAPIVIEKPEM